ncbi:MAG TPA: hypothetical protein VE988_04240 [Gemmataceae bacterium]|nr:hypothetical protein [Gemmataceae bacterium]
MSNVPEQQNESSLIEQARRQINRLAEEIAHLSDADLAPSDYYGEFLQRVLQALAAPAGAVWLLTQQGNLQLQYQINMREVGLDRSEEGRESHDELLRTVLTKSQPVMVPPRAGLGQADGNRAAPGNPTDFMILLAPIVVDKHTAGVVEIWQDPKRGPDAQRGFLQFLVKMAGLAAGYARNAQLRQMVGQQQVWTQLEAFARQIHNSLNPTEVAYVVANEGRRLVECDRVSVGLRHGRKVKVEAISGADVVEKRSNLVQLMRKLFDAVIQWGDKLVFTGTKDDSLPPNVYKALDAYLAESTSKTLVVLPLRDEREAESKKPPRSVIMMEAFDPPVAQEQLIARLEVIGKHAAPAFYNAIEYKRIPFRFIWLPVAKVQDGLGGKAKAITATVLACVVVLLASMIIVPYPLKMEANGQVLPRERPFVYPQAQGVIDSFAANLKQNSQVSKGQELVHLISPELSQQMIDLDSEIASLKKQLEAARQEQVRDGGKNTQLTITRIKLEGDLKGKENLRTQMQELYVFDKNRPGRISLRSPTDGVVLTSDFPRLVGSTVKESQPVLQIGRYDPKRNKLDDWEVELKIPQKHIGQVLMAFEYLKTDELEVDILLSSEPTRKFKGRLKRDKIAAEATPNKDANNESEPVTMAWVRLTGPGIAVDDELPVDRLKSGAEVRTRIRCGNHAMGYSLFYGVWEFFYEKVVFWF